MDLSTYKSPDDILIALRALVNEGPKKPIYTTDEAAKYLDLHPETLKKRARAGLIRPLPNYKRPLRFAREELDRYLTGSPILSGSRCFREQTHKHHA
ncbi:MAG: helix-turn-helix domain-containing protein [Oceanipulchritudo sp.]